MNARTGMILRLLGPLIEVACLIVLLRVRDQGRQVFGVPVEYLLYVGLGLGLTLVVVGRALVRPRSRRPGDVGWKERPDHEHSDRAGQPTGSGRRGAPDVPLL